MTDTFLIDKSALARVSLHESVLDALAQLDEAGVLATSPVIDLELGYSARDLEDFDETAADRRALYQELPLTKAISDRAHEVQRMLVTKDQHRGPGVPDLLIAATAELYGAVVVHYDRDFEVIAAHTGQATRWIVPRGSVP